MPTTYAIPNGRTVMDATTFTATGTTQTVYNTDNGTTGFKPDFLWTKNRSSVNNNILVDSVRGVSKYLISNLTDAEGTDANYVTSFNTNGFTLGTANHANGQNIIAWQWQAGQGTTSNNTSGTITSTVSANTTAGFSIVTYTGTGAAATVGHGLGVTPSMIIVKNRSAAATNWTIWFTGFASTEYMLLNLTDSKQTNGSTAIWTGTPTSSLFSVGSSTQTNGSTNSLVAYCWAQVPGFSQFGSYIGNGSTDGPFVYTGFRPKFIIIKRSDVSGDGWVLYDSARNTYNLTNSSLAANTSGAEVSPDSTNNLDFLSNGFKIRGTGGAVNNASAGGTYIYAVFAENPFKYANAR